jgi:alpha-glucosidase
MNVTKTGRVADRGQSLQTHGWQSLGEVTSHHVEDVTLVLDCGASKVRISLERNDIIRVRLAPGGQFKRDHSWAVVPNGIKKPSFGVEEYDEYLELVTPQLRVRIDRSPCRISFFADDESRIAGDDPQKGMCWDGGEIRAYQSLHADDHFFGMGEKHPPLDKRNQTYVNWNHDAAEHEQYSDPLYQTHPFVIVLNRGTAHGIFFDNTHRSSFDFGQTSRTAWSFGADAGELNYYFIPGPKPTDVIHRYASLVGTTPLPPLWALGYQQCRWSYDSAKRVASIAREFRKRKIPCDAIYIDIDYMDGFRSFTWDPKRFGQHEKLLKSLKKDGFKTVVILDPGIKAEPGYKIYDSGIKGDHFLHGEDGTIYVGKVWPGQSVYPDFTRQQTRQWWGDLYKDLLASGVTGIWNDMNEPADFSHNNPDAGDMYADAEGTIPLGVRFDNDGQRTDHREAHNVYGMQMARSTYDGMRRLRPAERPFVLTRAGYSGVQRHAAVWTGDNASTWDQLRMSVPMLLNMSVSGVIFCGADIGGFRSYPTPELYTRWLQLGIFYPLCRSHTAGGKEQDPFSFGKKHEKINRTVIKLRYALLPYIYTEMQHASTSGEPLLRPLFLDYPKMPRVHKIDHEFMFGRQLLVAPVLWETAKNRKFMLPPGQWYGFHDGKPHTGGEEIDIPVNIETIPMFARAGAIIPTRAAAQFVDGKPLTELTLNIFPGIGRGHFYNDDGLSYGFEKGEFLRDEYETSTQEDSTTFRLARRTGSDTFAPGSYVLKFNGIQQAPREVTLKGQMLKPWSAAAAKSKKSAARGSKGSSAKGWCYDKKSRSVHVQLSELRPGDTVELHHKPRSPRS